MNDTQLLLSRLDDCIDDYYSGELSFLGFLNESEIATCCGYLKNRYVDYTLFGGYPNSTRAFIFLGTDINFDKVPIRPLLICTNQGNTLSHRDYLGSLMGLGIKRECVGDILFIENGQVVVFVREEISGYIISELKSVGSTSVSVAEYTGDTSMFYSKTVELKFNVSSLRIDNIVSSIVCCSRSDAVLLITSDKVLINHLSVKKPSCNISNDDIISIRGKGKYIYKGISGTTRKGNLIISVLHYI